MFKKKRNINIAPPNCPENSFSTIELLYARLSIFDKDNPTLELLHSLLL